MAHGERSQRYYDYIASPAWRRRKDAYYSKHEKRCRRCKSTELIHLHHKTYKNLEREPDEDLVPLCQSCHEYVHRFHRERNLSLRRATNKAIAENAPRKKSPAQPRKKSQRKRRKKAPRPQPMPLVVARRAKYRAVCAGCSSAISPQEIFLWERKPRLSWHPVCREAKKGPLPANSATHLLASKS